MLGGQRARPCSVNKKKQVLPLRSKLEPPYKKTQAVVGRDKKGKKILGKNRLVGKRRVKPLPKVGNLLLTTGTGGKKSRTSLCKSKQPRLEWPDGTGINGTCRGRQIEKKTAEAHEGSRAQKR